MDHVNFLWSRNAFDVAATFADSVSNANPAMLDLMGTKIGVEKAVAVTHGRVHEALRLDGDGAKLLEKRGYPDRTLGLASDSAMVYAWFLGDNARAISIVQGALQRKPLSGMSPLTRPYASLAQIYSFAGRADLARGMLTEFETIAGTMPAENADANRHSMKSMIAIAEKRYPDAITELHAADVGSCTTCVAPLIGMVFDLAGQPDSAIATLTRYTGANSIMGKMNNDQYFLALSYRRLGELWENKGDKAKAAENYTKFIDLWKNADPELQPKVADAKARLAKLTGVEGKK
jgi:tetratricopeptide (TPR) repeat protein